MPKGRRLTLAETADAIRRIDRLIAVPHVDPDPDTLGAAVGLALIARKLGKEARVYTPEAVPFDSRFLEDLYPIEHSRVEAFRASDHEPPDAGGLPAVDGGTSGGSDRWHPVVLDCGDPRRIHPAAELPPIWLNIDHHLDNAFFAELTWVDPSAASTAEMVARLGFELGVEMDAAIATALYAGMLYDTRGFVIDKTNAETYRLAARLVDAGADPAQINRYLNEQLSASALRVMGMALGHLQEDLDGKLVWATITQAMLAACGARIEETDLILSELPKIGKAEVWFLFKELPDGAIKISIRSRGKVNAHAIARAFGGGGHRRVSGARLDLPLSAAVELMLTAARTAMQVQAV
jgi:phosphoesterase RecJ-like protein